MVFFLLFSLRLPFHLFCLFVCLFAFSFLVPNIFSLLLVFAFNIIEIWRLFGSKKHKAARLHILVWFRQLFNVKKIHFSMNKSLRDASANRTPRPHSEPAALTDGLISVYSPLSFSEVPWQHVYVLMGICIFLWLLPVTANQLKLSKSLNKYSGLFTKHRERSDGWVINAYLSDPSYGDFRLIAWGLPLFALRRAMGHKCQVWDEIHGRYGWRWSMFEGFFAPHVCVFSKRERKAKRRLCVCLSRLERISSGPVMEFLRQNTQLVLWAALLIWKLLACIVTPSVLFTANAKQHFHSGEEKLSFFTYLTSMLVCSRWKIGQTSQVDKANTHILKGSGVVCFYIKDLRCRFYCIKIQKKLFSDLLWI